MKLFLPIDHEARRKAVTETTRSLNVEAGAGTGKTFLLTARFVHLVESGAAPPSQIVAITFTEKAASQLRDRIRKALEAKRLTASLEELDRAPISTIHSFAGSLLRERPFEAGIDPNFQQLDALAGELFLRSAYERWLAEALGKTPKSSSPLSRALAAGISLDRVTKLAFDLYAHRDLLFSLPVSRKDLDVEKFFSEIVSEARALFDLASKSCVEIEDAGYRAIEALHREVDAVREAPRTTKERAILLRISASPKGNQKNWANPKTCEEQKERMKRLGEGLVEARKTLRTAIFSELAGWLQTFVAHAEREKLLQGKLDFDDLLFKARDLLKKRADVREYFQAKFKYILVDEFQDTDPIQTELVWLLAAKPMVQAESWRDLTLEPGKLFIVGDPKQSIYRFRRASLEVYSAASGQLSRQGERLVIHQNFRASEPLVEWVNAVFPSVLQSEYAPISADSRHLSSPEKKPTVLLEPPEDETLATAGQTRRLEAEAIAAHLRTLLDDPEPRVFDPTSGNLRPVKPGDVALLFPTTTDLDLFEEALRRYDLPFSLEGGHLFYHRTEIHAVLSALDAIAHPTDPIAVVAALRSVLFGLSDQDLWMLVSRGVPLDYRHADTKGLPEPIPTSFSILRELHQHHIHRPPSQILGELLYRTGAVPITLTRRHGEQAAANLEKFVSLARHHERLELTHLDGFVQWVRERTEEAERQAESPLAEEDAPRIRLLTIHKAKGLEFPVVVLANLSVAAEQAEMVLADRFENSLAIGIGPKDARFATLNFEEISEREKLRRLEEKRRLLYVAATRARDLLILPRFLSERSRKESLWSILEEGIEQGSRFMERIPFLKLALREGAAPEPEESEEKPEFSLVQEEEKLQADFARRRTTWIPGLPIRTATELVHGERFKTTAATLESSGAAVGSALHGVMERIDFVKRSAQLKTLCRLVALEFGIPEAAPDLEALAQKAFDAPIFERITKAKQVHREVPFSWRKDETIYEGVIDLVLEEENGLVLIDYKTDRVSEKDLKERVDLYAPQIRLYAEALSVVTGKRVKAALLFFVRGPRSVEVIGVG